MFKVRTLNTKLITYTVYEILPNLFFTITSSILSIGFILGKNLEFTITATIGMIIFTLMSFVVTFFWARLIKSYGKLNEGKFIVINKIEKQLRTNMFEDEWKILKETIKYKPNTKTEYNVIVYFRIFIEIIGIVGLLYLYYLLCL